MNECRSIKNDTLVKKTRQRGRPRDRWEDEVSGGWKKSGRKKYDREE
jgi:hypothetical protein